MGLPDNQIGRAAKRKLPPGANPNTEANMKKRFVQLITAVCLATLLFIAAGGLCHPHAEEEDAMENFSQETAQQTEAPPVQPAAMTLPLIFEDPVMGHVALAHSPNHEVHATVDLGHRYQAMPVDSDLFKRIIAMKYHKAHGKVPKKSRLKEIVSEFYWSGLFDGPKLFPNLRYAKFGDTVYVDLCDREGRFVRIGPDGWSVHRHSLFSVLFVRYPGMKEQVLPERGGSIEELRPFLNLRSDDQLILTVAFILGAMQPDGPFPIFTVHGPQGASKSTMLRIIRSIVDPSEAALTTEPSSERDLFISARHTWMPCIDNVSKLSNDMSNAYCRLVTEGVFRTRELYTSTGETIIKAKRPLSLNGISFFANKNDFQNRSIWLDLPSVSAADRRPEGEIWADWERVRPRILGAFFDAVSMALRNLNQVKLDSLPRLADFAKWVVAAEPACPWAPGNFMRAYEDNRSEMVDMALESDPIGDEVRKLMKNRSRWSGTTTNLMDTLNGAARDDIRKYKEWPKAANTLANRLMRLEGFLATKGIHITKERHPDKRLLIITKIDDKPASSWEINQPFVPTSRSETVEKTEYDLELEEVEEFTGPMVNDDSPAEVHEIVVDDPGAEATDSAIESGKMVGEELVID